MLVKAQIYYVVWVQQPTSTIKFEDFKRIYKNASLHVVTALWVGRGGGGGVYTRLDNANVTVFCLTGLHRRLIRAFERDLSALADHVTRKTDRLDTITAGIMELHNEAKTQNPKYDPLGNQCVL